MRTTLIVTTYNWPQALQLVLLSIRRQALMPFEVLVADDGSASETAALIAREAANFPVPLRHIWQEDEGFRAARIRNLAISAARGDYLLLIDGDMVLHPQFVRDHQRAARPGCFVQGVRVLTQPEGARRMLESQGTRLKFLSPGLRRRRHTLRLPWLSRILLPLSASGSRMAGIKTCNQGWWRRDLIALNGFDERMVGWGREDEELAQRAYHAGLRRRSLRFAGLAYHLFHRERHVAGNSANDVWLEQTRRERRTRCDLGLAQHLE